MTDPLVDYIRRKESGGFDGGGVADILSQIPQSFTPLPEVAPLDLEDPVNTRVAEILGGPGELQKAYRFDTYEANGIKPVQGNLRGLVDKYRRARAQAVYELGADSGAAQEIAQLHMRRIHAKRQEGGGFGEPQAEEDGAPQGMNVSDMWPIYDPARHIDPLARVTSGLAQASGAAADVFTGVGYGIASMLGDPASLNQFFGLQAQLGGAKPDGDVLIQALMRKANPRNWDIPLPELYKQELVKERGIEESAGIVEDVLRFGSQMTGELTAMFATPLARAITVPGTMLKSGAAALKAPKWMQKAAEVAGAAVGWGTLQGISQYYDPATGEMNDLGRRVAIGMESAMWWPVYDAFARGATAVLKGAKRAEATEAFWKWAEKNGAVKKPGSPNGWTEQSWNLWIAEGMPGLSKNTLRDVSQQSLVYLAEAGAFTMLDAEMRKDLVSAFAEGDQEATERAITRLLGTWIGIAAMKAGSVEYIPQLKREQAPRFTFAGPEMPGPPKLEAPKGEGPTGKGKPAEPKAGGGGGREALPALEHMGWRPTREGSYRLIGDDQRTFRISESGEVEVSDSLLPVIRDSDLPPLEALQQATLRNHLEARRLFSGLRGREVDTDGSIVVPSPDTQIPSRHVVARFGSVYEQPFFSGETWRSTELPPVVQGAVSPQQRAVFDQIAGLVAGMDLPADTIQTAVKALEVVRDVPRELDPVVDNALRFAETGLMVQLAAVDPRMALESFATIAAGYQTPERALQQEVAQAPQEASPQATEQPVAEVEPADGTEAREADAQEVEAEEPAEPFVPITVTFGKPATYNKRKRIDVSMKGSVPEKLAEQRLSIEADGQGTYSVVGRTSGYSSLHGMGESKRSETTTYVTGMSLRDAKKWISEQVSGFNERGGKPNDAEGSEAGSVDPKLLAGVVASVGAVATMGTDIIPYAAAAAMFDPWAKSLMDKVRETGPKHNQAERDEIARRARQTVDDYARFRGFLAPFVSDMLWKTTGIGFDPRVVLSGKKASRAIAATTAASFFVGPIATAISVPAGAAVASALAGRTKAARGLKQATRQLEEVIWEPVANLGASKSTLPAAPEGGKSALQANAERLGVDVVDSGPDFVRIRTESGNVFKVRVGATAFHRLQDGWAGRSKEDSALVERLRSDEYVRQIDAAAEALTDATGRLAESVDLQIRMSNGNILPFKVDLADRRMVRAVTPEQIAIRLAPGSEYFDLMASATALFTGIPRERVVRELDNSTPQETRMDGREMQRVFRYVFDHMEVSEGGLALAEVVRLYEARPHQWARSMSEKAAKRFSFINNFGQDLFKIGESGDVTMGSAKGAEVKALLGKIKESGMGEEKAIRNLIRALNGIPIDVEMSLMRWGAGPKGRIARSALRTAMGGVTVMKSAALSFAYLINMPETYGNLAFVTKLRHVVHAQMSLAKAVWDGSISQVWDDLRNRGIITEEVPYTALDAMWDVAGLKRAWAENRLDQEVASRASVLSAATKFANEMNDVIAGVAAIAQVQAWKTEGGTPEDVVKLKALGYSDAEAKRLTTKGQITDKDENTYAQRVVAQTQGGTEHKAERGTIQQMKLWGLAGPGFDTYAATTARLYRNVAKAIKEARASGEFTPREAFKLAAKLMAKKMLTADASRLLKMMVLFGVLGGLEKYWRGWALDPLEEIEGLAWIAAGGGPADALRYQMERADELTDVFAIPFTIRAASEIGGAVVGAGHYADMPVEERFVEFFRRNVPVYRYHEIAQGNQDLLAAESMAWDWVRAHDYEFGSGKAAIDPETSATDKEFRSLMRSAMRKMEAGDMEGWFNGVMDAAAVGGDARTARSLVGKSVYSSLRRMVGEERLPEIAEHLGGKYWGEIVLQHETIKDLAKTLR